VEKRNNAVWGFFFLYSRVGRIPPYWGWFEGLRTGWEKERLFKTLLVIFFLQYDPMHKQESFYLLLFCFQTMITILSESGWRQLGDFLDRLNTRLSRQVAIRPPYFRSLLSLFLFHLIVQDRSTQLINWTDWQSRCRVKPTLGTHQISKFFFSSQRSFSREKFALVGYIITQSVLVTTKQDFQKKTLPSSVLCSFSLSKH